MLGEEVSHEEPPLRNQHCRDANQSTRFLYLTDFSEPSEVALPFAVCHFTQKHSST